MLVQMLEYKCKLADINVVIVNEAYTSKCSFLDREKISKHVEEWEEVYLYLVVVLW